MWVSEGGVGGCYCCDRCNSSLNLEQNNYFLLEKREEAFRCAFEDNWILKLFDYVHIDWQQRENELCNYEIMMMKTRQAFFFFGCFERLLLLCVCHLSLKFLALIWLMIEKIYEHEACCFYFFTLISFQHIAWLASFFCQLFDYYDNINSMCVAIFRARIV